jgi:ferredoxin-NADP reductase
VARAAIRGRLAAPLPWRVARLVDSRDESATARTLVLQVDGWPGHLAGQHVDVRLTAEDGYSTQRSYSIASAENGDTLELTVQLLPDGEVSSYLVQDYKVGDPIELRGPVGGWFVWHPDDEQRVLLVGGGSGVVPLMAMLRARRSAGSSASFRLLYSVRTPDDVLYGDELAREHDVTFVYTRTAPAGHARPAGRLSTADLPALLLPQPRVYVCGPTGFVEAVSQRLVDMGYDALNIRTERFGPSGA